MNHLTMLCLCAQSPGACQQVLTVACLRALVVPVAAVIYWVAGLSGSLWLWYKRLYHAARHSTTAGYVVFFLFYFVHICWCIWCAIGECAWCAIGECIWCAIGECAWCAIGECALLLSP